MDLIFEWSYNNLKLRILRNSSDEFFLKVGKLDIRFHITDENVLRFTTNGQLTPVAYGGSHGIEIKKLI